MPVIFDSTGSYRQTFTTGDITTIAVGAAATGHLLALRTGARVVRLRSLQAEFLLTTAFGAAQEVAYEAYIARSYTVAHGGGTALTLTGNTGKLLATSDAATLTGRVASASALTAGTHTLDTNAIARGSVWAAAIGAQLLPRCSDFTGCSAGGIYLTTDAGLIVRNGPVMGATGVGKWHFTVEWDEGVLA